MNFAKGNIRSSPYVGVFATVTDDFAIIPTVASERETQEIEKTLEVPAIRALVSNSPLLGILSKGLGKKLILSGLAEKNEVKVFEKAGLEVLTVDSEGFTAIGNLVCFNKNGGVASPLLSDELVEEMGSFLKIKLVKMAVGGSELAGSALSATNKGFICHPNTSEEDFAKLGSIFGVYGKATSANFGDLFVGNSVIGNSKGVVAGTKTSGIEMLKIDEALRGD